MDKSRKGDKDKRLGSKPAAHPKKEYGEKSQRFSRGDKHERGERYGKSDRYDKNEKPQRFSKKDRHERGDRYGKSDGYGKNEKTQRSDRSDKPYRDEKHQRYDRAERPGRDEKHQRQYKSNRDERSDRHDKYDKREKGDRAKREVKTIDSDTVRLNKFIANSGICSRREADEYIKLGLVTVNGKIVTELGTKVKPDDDIRFDGERLKGEKKVYILMNKPKDYVTTMSDPHAKKCVIDLISPDKCKERVVPVGRLDKATTGVLLFTNDGDLAARLTHPSYNVKKIYHVFLDKNLTKNDFEALVKGITLEDGEIHADSLSYVDDDMSQVGIEIHSGRNRLVRRMFEHLGYKVVKLDRVYFAGLTKRKLRRGAWRFLTEEEITFLKMGNFN